MSSLNGKAWGDFYGKLGMSQSPRVENARKTRRLVFVGVIRQRKGRDANWFAGRHDAAFRKLRSAGVGEEGVSHFICEMSCGEVVAGSPLFPGRAFEFSFLPFSPSPPLHSWCIVAVSPLDGDKGQVQ